MKDHNKKNRKNSKKALKGGEMIAEQSKQIGPGDPIIAQPLEVRVYGNNFEKALKAFRTLVQKERILSDYKEKQAYEKPSDKRRRKRNESKRKLFELSFQNHKRNRRDVSPE